MGELLSQDSPSPTQNGNAVRDNEAKSNRDRQRSHPILWWAYRYRLSADNGERKYRAANDFHGYDWRSRSDEYNLPSPEFTYRVAIITSSAAVFSLGIGQCLTEIIGR